MKTKLIFKLPSSHWILFRAIIRGSNLYKLHTLVKATRYYAQEIIPQVQQGKMIETHTENCRHMHMYADWNTGIDHTHPDSGLP